MLTTTGTPWMLPPLPPFHLFIILVSHNTRNTNHDSAFQTSVVLSYSNRGLDALGGGKMEIKLILPHGHTSSSDVCLWPQQKLLHQRAQLSVVHVSVGEAQRQHFSLNAEVSFIKNVCYSQPVSNQSAHQAWMKMAAAPSSPTLVVDFITNAHSRPPA